MDNDTQTTGNEAPDKDTADTQASEAGVQTNNEAPDAAQEVKEPEAKAEDTVEEKLYAGKYKSAEDMEKAYKELESKFGKETSEKAELTRILNEAFAVPDTSVADTNSDDDVETTPQENETEGLKRDTAVLKFIISHQDADGAEMKKILNEDPMIKQISGHDAKLEYAYLRSQNMSKSKAIAEAKKTGQEEAQAKTAEKTAAQVESAKKSEPIDEDGDLLEKATGNYDQATRDAARLKLIRKNLVNL